MGALEPTVAHAWTTPAAPRFYLLIPCDDLLGRRPAPPQLKQRLADLGSLRTELLFEMGGYSMGHEGLRAALGLVAESNRRGQHAGQDLMEGVRGVSDGPSLLPPHSPAAWSQTQRRHARAVSKRRRAQRLQIPAVGTIQE